MRVAISRHAADRMQKRAFPPAAFNLLWDYATSVRSKAADSLYFDRTARRRALAGLDSTGLRNVERLLNAFAIIVDDGSLITIAWRTRRLRRV